MDLDLVGREIVDGAIKVHRVFGPGLLESAYERALAHELSRRGFEVRTQVALPVIYEGTRLGIGYRLDLVVEGSIVIEVKAVERLLPIHQAQLISYLKLGKYPLGYLMNFHEYLLKDGLRRFAN